MPAFTLKKIPEGLMERIRARAEEERRSVTQEIYHLLQVALDGLNNDPQAEARRQVDAWSQLAGRWQSDEPRDAEIGRIYDARTPGRTVVL